MYKFAIIGFGKMGIFHTALFNAHPEVSIVAVTDKEKGMLKMFGKLNKNINTYSSIDDLKQNEDLDGILITTPQNSHLSILEKFNDLDIHSFVEKPLTDHVENLEKSIISDENSKRCVVGYVMRFHPVFNHVKKLLDANTIGSIRSYNGKYYIGSVTGQIKGWRTNAEKSGGGALITNASHLIDMLSWYFGLPQEVSGKSQYIHDNPVEDAFFGTLVHKDGLIGTIETDWSRNIYRMPYMSMSISGEFGEIELDNDGIDIILFKDTSEFSKGTYHIDSTALYRGVYFDIGGIEYSMQAEAFIQFVKNGELNNLCSFNEAVNCQYIIDALYRSNADSSKLISTQGNHE